MLHTKVCSKPRLASPSSPSAVKVHLLPHWATERDTTAPLSTCQGVVRSNFANLCNLDDLAPRCYISRRTRRTCRRSSEAEQGTHKPLVAGSNPAVGTIFI
jgi:hypothetical protein